MKNKIIHGDCLVIMKSLNNNSIDLVVTSPPYDNLRTYEDSLNWSKTIWENIIKELYRVIKLGGVVVWVVGDSTIKGSETGTSFKQALYFKEIGFRLHDTMIYAKNNPVPIQHNRYQPCFEYMFVFSKGKPKTFNPIQVECKTVGNVKNRGNGLGRETTYSVRKRNEHTTTNRYKYKKNIWFYNVGKNQSSKDSIAFKHHAIFPEQLAKDHIISWSNEGDLILDPFAGSGTTAIACIETNRNYIMIEKEQKYIDIINERIKDRITL